MLSWKRAEKFGLARGMMSETLEPCWMVGRLGPGGCQQRVLDLSVCQVLLEETFSFDYLNCELAYKKSFLLSVVVETYNWFQMKPSHEEEKVVSTGSC